MSFLSNLLASLLAGIILIIALGALSEKARWLLTSLLGRFLGIDVEYVFPNKNAAATDITSELKRSTRVDLFTSRGNELQRGTFAYLLGERPSGRQIRFRLLLPNPQRTADVHDWIAQRERELESFDPAFGTGILRSQIKANVQFLQQYVNHSLVDLRLFDCPHIGRILITDRFVYFTPYRKDSHGRDTPVIKYRSGGDMYNSLARLFEQLWDSSETLGG